MVDWEWVNSLQSEPKLFTDVVDDQLLGFEVQAVPPGWERRVFGEGREETLHEPIKILLAFFRVA